MKKIIFQETQKFSQWWLWGIILVCLGFSIRPIWKAYESGVDLSSDQLWGLGIIVLVILFFISLKLSTTLTEEGIYVQFFPVHWKPKFYAWETIERKEVVKYSPLLDFGGWGIRFGRKGKAYNVKGNKGLQIIFKTRNGLIIGTQKAEELQNVLDEFKIFK